MTETSFMDGSWFKSMLAIQNAILTGDLAAWVYWKLGGKAGDDEATLYLAGKKTKGYHGYKHFARYIRPDARRVKGVYTDDLLKISAFTHRANKTMSIVAINAASSSKTISLGGDNLPASFTMYTTTSTQNHANKGTVSSSGSITLPGNSISTLYATGYTPRGATSTAPVPGANTPEITGSTPSTWHASVYTVNGTKVMDIDNISASSTKSVFTSLKERGCARGMYYVTLRARSIQQVISGMVR